MATHWMPKWKEALLQGLPNTALTGSVRVLLIDTGAYTQSDTHTFLSDVAAPARISTSPALASKTYTLGVFDAADTSWTSVTGPTAEAMYFYIDTGTESTSYLVLWCDSGTGLPVLPNGGNIDLQFNNGADRIGRL
jgi:hypothetical protein